MVALLAVNWQPQLHGIMIVIISCAVLMGSVYLILGTNLGARLGFLVALTALAGWMFLMGAIWWTYGKGLLGPAPTWQPVAAKTVLQDTAALREAGLLQAPIAEDSNPAVVADKVATSLRSEKWKELDPSAPTYQQAGAAAGTLLEEAQAFGAGEFQVVHVFEIGGERSPQLLDGKLDFLAFLHKPHYSLVEVAPLVVQRAEPGRAPAAPVIDTSRAHQYVYMIRDLGAVREPAGFITVGSLIAFLALCYLLH
ncbi:MAG: hypothetical protein ABIQ39_04290, partial [Ilumatobacteraceae bacterium]